TLRICYLHSQRARPIFPPASLIEGRLPERVHGRSEAWRPAAAARNQLPREARDPVRRALRPGREQLAARIRRKCRRWKHGPRPKIATVERREARVSRWRRKAPRKRLACRVTSTPGYRVMVPRVSRRSATPRGGERKLQTPGAKLRRANHHVSECHMASSGKHISI